MTNPIRRIPKHLLVSAVLAGSSVIGAQPGGAQLRGDSVAVAEAQAMVETMGGMAIWSEVEMVHFVHEWYPWYRNDTYVENEILDLTGLRSWVDRKSEITRTTRGYSPEGGRWYVRDGDFEYAADVESKASMARAPYNFYRIIKAVAVGDSFYEVRMSDGDIPRTRRIEFYGPDGALGGWVILNSNKEPIVKATLDYRYTLGPLKRFGNLWVPAWGVYGNGLTRYEMISLTGDNHPPSPSLFLPPPEAGN